MQDRGRLSFLLRFSWYIGKVLRLLRLNLNKGLLLRLLPSKASERLARLIQKWAGAVLENTGGEEKRKRVNLSLNRWERRNHVLTMRSYPTRMYLEITNRCNLVCRMCGGRVLNSVDARDIEMSVVDKVAPLLPYMTEVSLFGFGESLLSPLFFPILRRMPPSLTTRLITNGTALTQSICTQLVEEGLKSLSVSLDAIRSETHHYIRGGAHFDRVLDSMRFLQEEKKRRNRDTPELHLSFVLMKSNIQEFPDFIRLAERLGAAVVGAGYLRVFTEDMRQESLFYDQRSTNDILLRAKRIAKESGIRLILPPLFDLTAKEDDIPRDHSGECPEPWEFIYVQSNGTITPCCTYSRVMGDLNNQQFSEIWNNAEYQLLRKQLTIANFRPKECRECLNSFWNANSPQQHFHLLEPPAVEAL